MNLPGGQSDGTGLRPAVKPGRRHPAFDRAFSFLVFGPPARRRRSNSGRKCGASFLRPTFTKPPTVTASLPNKPHDLARLDQLTGGAFSAPTSSERSARVRDWLLTQPAPELLNEVFKELSVKDKGAAKLVRERIDEARRTKAQELLGMEWADKARKLLEISKLNMADAMAWQRDAAKAGAPLSREPLIGLKTQLADRVRAIEDLQHQVQVQREAAVLLAQRIEVLSTKSWVDAHGAMEALRGDVGHWQQQADTLTANASWSSVDVKYVPLLEASKGQLLLVWQAFVEAAQLAQAAAADPVAPLPPVAVWAQELRTLRGDTPPAEAKAAVAVRTPVDPQKRAQATGAVREVLALLEAEISQGHGKASAGAASALRQALKEHGRWIDQKLDGQVHAALAAAGELEGWQRWRADQLREELVRRAEGLLQRPAGQAMGGRKMQENLRQLREEWKALDQGGATNHGLWRRFDEACNTAHKVVEAWLEKIKADAAEHRAARLALIAEVQAWAAENRVARDDDWKGFARVLHGFADRWHEAGHVGEKMFAELAPLWEAALADAAAPLEALQAQSLIARQAMIDEANALGAAPVLRVDAVKALQLRWQAEAHRVPMERRREQTLWDAFRKPIDEAFNRKTAQREAVDATLSARDRAVIAAAKALETAIASGDGQAIRVAMVAVEAAAQGAMPEDAQSKPPGPAVDVTGEATGAPAADAAPVKAAPKPVVAMRGDDRPGVRREAPAASGARGKFPDRKDGPGRDAARGRPDPRGDRPAYRADAAPRLGDAAFRAQRDAVEGAQAALKRLAAQAHGDALTQLLSAWEARDASRLPSAQDLGARATGATRTAWVQAISGQTVAQPASAVSDLEALLRLEIAAELPTPAEHLDTRRALQLQLLTRRNAPTPAQTWGQDVAVVLAGPCTQPQVRRLQSVLKVLLKR